MNTAETIRHAVAEVEAMRRESRDRPDVAASLLRLKQLQARRFEGTYADLLASGPYKAAARFFLEELYSDRDYADRDAQFARIAGAVEKLFPRDVADTAAGLAKLHALTESLDHSLARAFPDTGDEVADYVHAWKAVDRRGDRERQLQTVLAVGMEMNRLTRLPGVRLMLRMMRAPASAAGLGSLQRFLESGFDTFTAVTKVPGGVERFLAVVREREQRLMDLFFDGETVACETELRRLLGQAR